MIKEKIITAEVIKKMYFCDICDTKTDKQRKCIMCQRDLCGKCLTYNWGDGDYYETYCKECWDTGKPFRQQIIEEDEKSGKIIENLHKEWKRLALENIGDIK